MRRTRAPGWRGSFRCSAADTGRCYNSGLLSLDSPQALGYLAKRFHLDATSIRLTALGGGVSNLVYLAEAPGVRCVVKQALAKLRVEQDWFCSVERIHRECAAMRALGRVLPRGAVPEVLFEDSENHIFAMQSAEPDAIPWKTLLIEGEIHESTAETIGRYHGAWLRCSESRPEWCEEFGDLAVFDDLRVDPYYRSTAARHPELESYFASLIKECLDRRISLVHGDLSPKNILVSGESVMLIDFEVVHWGDPSFDAGFLFNHLVLKAFHRPEWADHYARLAAAYRNALAREAGAGFVWIEPAALRHLGGLLLARIDGKSPAEYLTGEAVRERVRSAACSLMLAPPDRIEGVFGRFFS